MRRLLVIEDNRTIAENIAEYFRMKGWQVQTVHDGERAYEEIQRTEFDFFIVDRMIPSIDGLSLIDMVKKRGNATPYLFLTALDKTVDKLEGLSHGADDYIVKPFSLEELHLRVSNILARAEHSRREFEASQETIDIEDLSVNFASQRVSRGGAEIPLSPKEFALFGYLLRNRGRIVSREEIFEQVWKDYGSDFSYASDTINVHIAYIRKKLDNPKIIRTVKLAGYVID
jgi:DNA-binding response OmpR family regulator